MIVLMGKTASGKDTILNKLVRSYGCSKITTYTSRPIRPGEIPGVTYHYLTKEEFLEKIKENFFAEWKSYESVSGTWYYGVAKEDLSSAKEDDVIILTPAGYRDVKEFLPEGSICVYIHAHEDVIKMRLLERGDNADEAVRRLKSDRADFEDAGKLADITIPNNGAMSLEDIAKKIISARRK